MCNDEIYIVSSDELDKQSFIRYSINLFRNKKHLCVYNGDITNNQLDVILRNVDWDQVNRGQVVCFKTSKALEKLEIAYLESLDLPEVFIFRNRLFKPILDYRKLKKLKEVSYIKLTAQDLWDIAKDSEKVFQIGVLVSDMCNIKCIMCPFFSEDENYSFKRQRDNTKPKYNLKLSVFKKFLEDISVRGKCCLRFSANGEPFMNPDFMEMLKLAKEKGHDIVINTNGLLLNSSIIQKLANYKINYLTFSIEGITKESYERVRVGGKFEKIISVLRECKSLKDEGKATWEIQVFYNDLDELDFSYNEICDFFKDKADNITIRKPFMDIECKDFKGMQSLPFDGHEYCFDIITYPYLLSSGDVVPCSVLANNSFDKSFPWTMNVKDNNFNAILNKYKQYAKDQDPEFMKLCRNCKFWQHGYRKKGTCNDPIFATVDLTSWGQVE